MHKRIKSAKGLFGQIVHFIDGVKVGESWSGLLEGLQNHYDAKGRYIGYSDRGMIADLVHHDEHGNYIGETHAGLLGQKKHFSSDQGYVGETCDGFIGDTTDLIKESDFSGGQSCDDSFDGGEW